MIIVFSILIGASILFSVIPSVPGPLIMFALTLVYAYLDNFIHITQSNLLLLFLIALLSFTIDLIAGIVGAKYGGASSGSLIWGWIGLLLGTFLIPIAFLGSFIGLFLGVFLSELIFAHKSRGESFKAAFGGLLGALAGTFGNVFIAFLYFALFLFFVIK